MAFHAFHTLSFPWPALGAGSECEVAEIPVFRQRRIKVHEILIQGASTMSGGI
jgi:hypothetical protein